MRIPPNALSCLRTRISTPTHDPAIGMSAPHHTAAGVSHEAEHRRRPARLLERRARFVPPPLLTSGRSEGVREVPNPDASLARRPEVSGGAAGERAEGGARLRLPQRPRTQLQRGWAALPHGGARGRTMDAGRGGGSGELREGVGMVRARGRGPDVGCRGVRSGREGREGVAGVDGLRGSRAVDGAGE